jgi:hypothetical protein
VTTEPITIRVGAQSVAADLLHFDSVDEAIASIGTADLLVLINHAYRLQQLAAMRKVLERHPRVSV